MKILVAVSLALVLAACAALPLDAGPVSGIWSDGANTYYLEQHGNQVTGTYRDGNSSIRGTLKGRVWSGTFQYNQAVSGTFTYTFSADFNRFSGKWANSTDSNHGTASGRRVK